jgi:hypothetical protein
MKSMLVCVASLALLVMNGAALAAGYLETKFDHPVDNGGRRSDAGKAIIEFQIRNTGDTSITYSVAQLPIPEPDGYLTNNMLRVTDANGDEAAYRGLFVSYADRAKSAQRVLRPGEVRTSRIDLLKNYQLRPGVAYNVELRFGASYAVGPVSQDASGATPTRRTGSAGSIRVWLDPYKDAGSRPPLDGTTSRHMAQRRIPNCC